MLFALLLFVSVTAQGLEFQLDRSSDCAVAGTNGFSLPEGNRTAGEAGKIRGARQR